MKKRLLFLGVIVLVSFTVILLRENVMLKSKINIGTGNIEKVQQKDMLSMMLETEAGSGNYELTTRDSWPTEGYIFNSALSKCENGGELSWDDENKRVLMSGNVSDKCYVYFDLDNKITLANYIISQYNGVQGNNNIYYHDSTLANGAGDNSYRYAGPSDQVNNFVCFGTTESPCQTDNLYRIVGVFEESYHGVSEKQLVKLIKYDYANSNLLGTDGDYEAREAPLDTDNYKGSLSTINTYYWNSNTTNTWSTSLLNKTNLNTNFINNIGTTWANKIATTIWKVGGNTYANITSKTPSVAYQNEITNPDATNSTDNATEYQAKIGLMYVSDYGFAASPSAWTTTLYSYDGSDTNENAIETINWMPMGVREWTISRSADSSHYSGCAFIVQNYSAVNVGNVDNLLVVRPSFSLESSVTYVSGSGSMSDPIIIN